MGEGEFDVEKLIDLLQALEKFTAVRDEGDGTAFKVNGVRGSRIVGSAGDFIGSQQVDTSERDTDIDGGRFRVSTVTDGVAVLKENNDGKNNDEQTVHEALSFFFSQEGDVLREFLLEEVVTVVDASSRQAVQELTRTLGFGNFPVPSLFRALNPELTEQDKRMVQQIGKLVQFFFGDFEGALQLSDDKNGRTSERLRKLTPVLREYAPQLRDFGTLLVARLTEKNLARGLNWANQRLATASR